MAKMTAEQKRAYGKQKGDEMQERWFDAIADAIADERIPWRKPWKGGTFRFPTNLRSKKTYRGGNLVSLLCSAVEHGFTDLRFATRKQLIEAGYSIKGLKNGSGFPIRYVKQGSYEKENDNGEMELRSSWLVRFYEVWCVEQCEGYEAPAVQHTEATPTHEMMAHFNTYVESQPSLKLQRGGDRAFYRLSQDLIQLPEHAAFTDSLGEVMTAFHEAGHSTGHPNRVERPLGNGFGSAAYAFEELVAEFSAMLTVVSLGGDYDPSLVMEENANSVAYLQSWLKACDDRDKDLTAAFAKAQEASDFILATIMEGEEE